MTSPDDLDAVSPAELSVRFVLEITMGRTPETSRHAPLDTAQRAMWDRLADEIAEGMAKGWTVDVPHL